MVISVDTFKPDLLKPTEMVSLLLNDEDLERRFCQQLEERRLQIKESTATTTTATTPVKQQTKRKLKAKQSSPQSAKKKCSKRFNPENNEIFKDISHYSVDDIESYNDNESESNSPYSEQMLSITTEGDCNNDELYVDDHNSLSSMSSPMSGSSGRKKCGGRGRGRPRGSKTRATVTTRSSLTSAALAAAELAGAQAGKSAALAVYPFLSSSHQSSGGNTQNNNNNNNSIVANLNQRRNRGARSGRSKNWTTIDN
ncbi:chromatin-remodeling ATPase INO80-like [Oppia nitens]|nr:chromatin-remodeling ATPase INO80-like [Oppia nitens]